MPFARFAVPAELVDHCSCGVESRVHHFGCLECNAVCCSACAITLESVAYCRRCAAALLGAEVDRPGPFELL